MKHTLLSLFFFLLFPAAYSQDSTYISENGEQVQLFRIDAGTAYEYKDPAVFRWLTDIPSNFITFPDSAFQKKHLFSMWAIFASTAILIHYDQPLIDGAQELGRDLGIGNGENTKTYITLGGYPFFRGPSDAGSAMYFIGDGWTHLGFCLGFYAAGLIGDDYRALTTASNLAEGILTLGITTQVLKHLTGRESPFVSTEPGGRWRLFPDQVEYHKKVPSYDAYPSGHVATAMLTLTVIAENYPEYEWIYPLGGGLITLLSYQMMNNGVHWISDYPLSLGLGYIFGKIIVDRGRKKINFNGNEAGTDTGFFDKLEFSPGVNRYGGMSLNLSYPY